MRYTASGLNVELHCKVWKDCKDCKDFVVLYDENIKFPIWVVSYEFISQNKTLSHLTLKLLLESKTSLT